MSRVYFGMKEIDGELMFENNLLLTCSSLNILNYYDLLIYQFPKSYSSEIGF